MNIIDSECIKVGIYRKPEDFIMQPRLAIAITSLALIALGFLLIQNYPPHFALSGTIASAALIKRMCEHQSGIGLFKPFAKKYKDTSFKDQDVMLIITAKEDHNGALDMLLPDQIEKLKNQKDYKIVTKKVSSIQDINDLIEDLTSRNNRIGILWIRAHGSQKKIFLDDSFSICNSKHTKKHTFKPLAKGLNKLSERACILLESCSTGRIDAEGTPCIAQSVAVLAKGRKVIAPITDCSNTKVRLVSIKPFEFKFFETDSFLDTCERNTTAVFCSLTHLQSA